MTPLTTPIFDFHQVISALTTPFTTPTPTLSLVKNSLKAFGLISLFLIIKPILKSHGKSKIFK